MTEHTQNIQSHAHKEILVSESSRPHDMVNVRSDGTGKDPANTLKERSTYQPNDSGEAVGGKKLNYCNEETCSLTIFINDNTFNEEHDTNDDCDVTHCNGNQMKKRSQIGEERRMEE